MGFESFNNERTSGLDHLKNQRHGGFHERTDKVPMIIYRLLIGFWFSKNHNYESNVII